MAVIATEAGYVIGIPKGGNTGSISDNWLSALGTVI